MEDHPQISAAVVQGAGNVTFNNAGNVTIQAVAGAAENRHTNIPSENEEVTKSKNADHHQLSEFIWIHQDKPLGKRDNVFEGEMRSDVCNPRRAAIKYIPYNEKNVKEAKILEKLTPHPHVVAILHSNTVPGPMKYLYIAMEQCHTQNLQEFIIDRKKQGVPFDVLLVFKYTKQLIDGMRHIHKNKIIHRDLKPENILFSFDMQSIKISDFGLSKEMKSGRSVTKQSTLRLGTDGFRAPETYNENVISLKADIFSLALVLCFLWSYGHHPFGNDPDLWNFNIKNNQNRDLKSLLIPQSSVAINLLERMLKFEPILRPTIEEIFQDLFVIELTAAVTRGYHCDETSDAPTYEQVGQQAPTSRDWQTQQALVPRSESSHTQETGKHQDGPAPASVLGESQTQSNPSVASLFAIDNPSAMSSPSGWPTVDIAGGNFVAPQFGPVDTTATKNVSDVVMPTNPFQQMTSHSGETPAANQVIPVDIAGGNFFTPQFGPVSTTVTKNVGFAEGDFRGSHIGPTYHIHQSAEDAEHNNPNYDHWARQGVKRLKYDGERCQLSGSFWFFKDRRLAKKETIFEGEYTNEITGNQPIAIKLIWHYTKKNEREAKNLVKLRPHIHVVAILEADVYKGMPGVDCLYIAMEICSTLNLEDYIKERRAKNVPFSPTQAFEHAKQLINAINHIHGHDILHLDLKPSSVLFSACGRYLKICDFGTSKELENGRSVTSMSTLKVGTDGYRAPETYNKNDISKMADIFSLALVLYYLFSYGFHPFGIDPEIWNFNIKKGRSRDLSRLRVPFLKIAEELLKKMLQFLPEDRLKIDQVKSNEFMKLDWFSSIIESLVIIWNGTVKDHVGADMLSCQLYTSPSLQDVVEIDGSDWKFQMQTVPYLDIGSLKKVTDEEPSGYIVTSKDELRKLTDKLSGNNLMGWIDVSKDGDESKVIVILPQPGYSELFGLFLPDAKILTSLIENLASKQRPTLQKPTAVVGGIPAHQSSTIPDPTTVFPTHNSPNLQAQSSELSTRLEETAPVSIETSDNPPDIIAQDSTKEQEVASAKNQQKQVSPDLIPWWIFTGILQN